MSHHQDLRVIVIGNPKKKTNIENNIISRNNVDLHAIKVENEKDNFQIKYIPKKLAQEITQTRNLKKITQKELAIRLNVQKDVIHSIENGKAIYNGKTKELINKIQNICGIKFKNK